MEFKLTEDTFRDAFKFVKNSSVTSLSDNKVNIETFIGLQETLFLKKMARYRRLLYHYKQQETKTLKQRDKIQEEEVNVYRDTFDEIKGLSIYNDSKTDVLQKMKKSQQAIGFAEKNLEEMKIQVKREAREVDRYRDVLFLSQKRLFVLKIAIAFRRYLEDNHVDPFSLADFEVDKYHSAFRREWNHG